MQSINADQVPPQAWRNGGGRTRELLTLPAGTDWKLRVSLADIDADGPFSAFAGVERRFAVVQGAGVRLTFNEGERTLRPGDAPLRFDGAEAPHCTLVNGPTRDLNLMLRGGAGTMRAVQAGEWWHEGFEQRGLFTLVPGRWQTEPMGAGEDRIGHPVAAHTLLWGLPDGPCRFVPDDAAALGGWWLGFSERPA
ncbi:MAG: hypothetical protein AD742_18590 [Methylibium sp. NZG]|nr:MAG: hypothetical protein AD742_18590 [Methylibium sp. NZG]